MAAIFNQIFDTAGTHTWTCPDDVHGVYVECIGPGGDANGSHGGGGGFFSVSWLDVVPGTDYEVFIADKTGDPEFTYFNTPDDISATRGRSASGSDYGVAGPRLGSLGTIMIQGGDGDGFGASPGEAGIGPGRLYNDTDPVPDYGTGGAAPGNPGLPGIVQLSWRVGTKAGNGGGGGGGYARSILSVEEGDHHTVHIGVGGLGQLAIPDCMVAGVGNNPLTNGTSTWFGNSSLVRAAGGDSAGLTLDESVSESEEDPEEDYQFLVAGGLGGGRHGSNAQNIGDVTAFGGNGGSGSGVLQRFGYIGGGGGGVGGRRGDGENGSDGADGGYAGYSSNDFNFRDGGVLLPRLGSGGQGSSDAQDGFFDINFGSSPGGGSGGDGLFGPGIIFANNTPTAGSNGRVLISGTKTGRLLIPGF